MEDFDNYKIFFYILIAVLYFLFGKKKAKPVQPQKNPQREVVAQKPVSTVKKPGSLKQGTETQKKPEPFTLEDVLKEFGNTLETQKPKPQVKKPKKEVIIEEKKPAIAKYEEKLYKEVPKPEKETEVESLEKDPHFSPYMLDGKHENKYAAFLSNPQGLKTAFITREILDRKHF